DALAGRAVDPDLADLADLARELREERPRVPTDAAERLDRAAAEGFGGGRDRIAAAWDRFRAVPPRRWVPALGAAATFVAVAGVAISESGLPNGSGRQA